MQVQKHKSNPFICIKLGMIAANIYLLRLLNETDAALAAYSILNQYGIYVLSNSWWSTLIIIPMIIIPKMVAFRVSLVYWDFALIFALNMLLHVDIKQIAPWARQSPQISRLVVGQVGMEQSQDSLCYVWVGTERCWKI